LDISIIIVNYRSASLILDCLKSIELATSELEKEIIIVDNDSKDNSRELITGKYPFVNWIQMGYNSGFARANNEGIRHSSSPVILLLNGDTIIENNAITKCLRQFITEDCVACGVQLLNVDRTPQISGNYFMKGGLNHLLPLPYLGKFLRSITLSLGIKKTNVSEARDRIEVDWINGAFLMAKRSAIEKSGLMDEDFFLYAEEAEWCSRLRKHGKLCIYGNCNVIHLQGETANEVYQSSGKGYQNLFDRKGLQIMISNLVRIRKQYGISWFLFILAIFIMDIPIFFIGYLISNLLFSSKYTFRQFVGYCRNVLHAIRLSPVILKNRPYFYKILSVLFILLYWFQ
jgi:GT2 family glycosyltransferase